MVIRPTNNKIVTTNASPFLVTQVQLPHVYFRSLTYDTELKRNAKNVRPLRLHLQPTPPADQGPHVDAE